MGKKVIITGATGMVGGLVLEKCIKDSSISKVVSIGRRAAKVEHDKLTQIVEPDFKNLESHQSHFKGIDCAYFCLGVYTGAVPTEKFKEITVDYTTQFATYLKQNSPSATFCLLSGAGADQKEKSRTAFARFKGMSENQLIALNFDRFHSFRPGYIYPVKKRKSPNMMYSVSRALYPVLKLFGKNASITSDQLASAMQKSLHHTPKSSILENRDILEFLEGLPSDH